MPHSTSIAYFDACFHRTIPPHIYSYAINQEIATKCGLRKYSFHGLSCMWGAFQSKQFSWWYRCIYSPWNIEASQQGTSFILDHCGDLFMESRHRSPLISLLCTWVQVLLYYHLVGVWKFLKMCFGYVLAGGYQLPAFCWRFMYFLSTIPYKQNWKKWIISLGIALPVSQCSK